MTRSSRSDLEYELNPPPDPDLRRPPRRPKTPFPADPKVLGRLDLRVGRVIHVEEHVTDPNKYFFEYVQGGDRVSNVFVRGLNKYFTPDDFEDIRVVLLYLARPGWMNNQESRLFGVLYGYTPEKVELLRPPAYTKPGDKIRVEGLINWGPPYIKPTFPFYTGDLEELLDQVAPDFRVNSNRIAEYKGVPLHVRGKGFVTTKTLTDCPVT